jgi:hypothetical protein
MSKRIKPHNTRNPNICRTCKINTIGKNRMALGHNVCQACSKRVEVKSELLTIEPLHNREGNSDD